MNYHLHARKGWHEGQTAETENFAEVKTRAEDLLAHGWHVWIFVHKLKEIPEYLGGPRKPSGAYRTIAEGRPGTELVVWGDPGMPKVTKWTRTG